MYATRRLSMCRKDPSILSEQPVEALNSGYLVITDEETEEEDTCCWGSCVDTEVRNLPFPQNKILNVVYTTSNGQTSSTERHKVLFLPVLDQPLSSNRYYVIRAKGKYTGQACACSQEEDMGTCCFCNYVRDVKPKVLDHRDIYQQVEIIKKRRGYYAKSVASDGFPPLFLRRKGWTVSISSSFYCELSEAHGLNLSLRMNLPEFDSPIPNNHSTAVVVGRWYCPFVFVKEDDEGVKDQMKNRYLFYEMTLAQWWEEIFSCENDNSDTNFVVVNLDVKKEVNRLFGVEAMRDDIDTHGLDGTVWYKRSDPDGKVLRLGLSIAIVEKMRVVQEMGGWVRGGDRDVRVERSEEFRGDKRWKRFRCFVLVERFALRRMDGTLLLTCDFRHLHKIQTKWE